MNKFPHDHLKILLEEYTPVSEPLLYGSSKLCELQIRILVACISMAVQKGKKRSLMRDAPTGPKVVHPTVLSMKEEAMCVAFRKGSVRIFV